MVLSNVAAKTFLALGLDMMGKEGTAMNTEAKTEMFITHFGTTPGIMSEIWGLLYTKTNFFTDIEPSTKPQHILWAFAKLKIYEKESVMASIVATRNGAPCGKTYREKSWSVIAAIASLTELVVSKSLHV